MEMNKKISRRSVAKTTTWSVPTLAAVVAAPQASASDLYTLTNANEVYFNSATNQDVCFDVTVTGSPASETVTFTYSGSTSMEITAGYATAIINNTSTSVCTNITYTGGTTSDAGQVTATYSGSKTASGSLSAVGGNYSQWVMPASYVGEDAWNAIDSAYEYSATNLGLTLTLVDGTGTPVPNTSVDVVLDCWQAIGGGQGNASQVNPQTATSCAVNGNAGNYGNYTYTTNTDANGHFIVDSVNFKTTDGNSTGGGQVYVGVSAQVNSETVSAAYYVSLSSQNTNTLTFDTPVYQSPVCVQNGSAYDCTQAVTVNATQNGSPDGLVDIRVAERGGGPAPTSGTNQQTIASLTFTGNVAVVSYNLTWTQTTGPAPVAQNLWPYVHFSWLPQTR